MNPWNNFACKLILLLLIGQTLYAQERVSPSISKLDRMHRRLEQRVRKTEQLLEQTRQVKKRSFNELSLLKEQINLRANLVSGLSTQIQTVESEIVNIDRMIASMQDDIVRFQKGYSKAAKTTYVAQGTLSVIMWVFSAQSFKQSYDRLMYFKEFSRYRKNQILLIKRTKTYLANKKAEKLAMRGKIGFLLDRKIVENTKLNQSIGQKDNLLNELKNSESQYQKQIENYREEMSAIKAQIKQLIIENRKEVSGQKREEVDRLSRNFANNKGKLPWPLPMNKGVITGHFGKTVTATGHQIINDGVFISTGKNQSVRAIFHGVVTLISKVPSYGTVVIVQHGNYRTVYANLDNVHVQKGDKVTVLQEIGEVHTNTNTGETQLYFQIYKGFNPVNPIAWIAEN
jgi:murein hydrolase activator